MITAAQAVSIRRESRPKGFNKHKIEACCQLKATMPEHSNVSKVLLKGDRHPALALVDLQTYEGDLIDSKCVHLYRIPTRLSKKKTLTTAI